MNKDIDIDDPAAFDTFAAKLNELSDNVRETGGLVGNMVADPGLFGILAGQIIGVAASACCSGVSQGFGKYGEALEKHKEKLDKAKNAYEAREDDVTESISRYQS